MSELRDAIVTLLQQAVNVDGEDGGTPGSAQQEELLRGLARHGNTLYQHLQPILGDVAITRSIQVTSGEGEMLPIEFAYDFGFPSQTARLCAHWKQALERGSCPTCKPRAGSVHIVCPMGFWGIRLIVERQLATAGGDTAPAGQPAPGRDTLPDISRVLFAASAKVDGVNRGERKRTEELLHEHLGDRGQTVQTWRSWRDAVRTHGPGLLLALPHQDAADDGLPILEIGKHSQQEVGAMTSDYVLSAGSHVGPVVMLLGCDTAQAEISWQSAASTFRRLGAAVVIGTLVQTLGRQTAPMARLVGETLWGAEPIADETMGEVVRAVRRRLVLQGYTLGMSLVAFGDIDWLVHPGSG
jgi:hypothetical protein